MPAPPEPAPSSPLRIPLLSGDGFAESLFLTSLWFAAWALALMALPLLWTGHYILAVLALLVGSFFIGAWWSFPGAALAQRPADIHFDRTGLRVVGGAQHGLQLAWDQIDAAKSGLGRDPDPALERLLIATRDGGQVVLARGDERQSFIAVIDILRAAAGLEPRSARSSYRAAGDSSGARKPRKRKQPRRGEPADADAKPPGPAEAADADAKPPGPAEAADADAKPAEPAEVTVDVIGCPGCGAPVVPADAATVACRRCGAPVPLPELLRTRLREVSQRAGLAAANAAKLRRLLAQPSSTWASVFVAVFAGSPLLLWFAVWLGCSALLVQGTLEAGRVVGMIAPTVLLGIALPIFAGLYTVRRRTVRILTLDFAAAPPATAGDAPRCRVCGAPLACEPGALLAGCAYCGARNIIAVTLPRSEARHKQQAASIEDAIGSLEAEMLFRAIGFVVLGVPAIWLAWIAVRNLLLA